MKQALIIGSTVVDVTVRLPHLPVTGEDVIVENQSMSLGGCAYNVSEILRQSGVPYILFSPVGTGVYGDYVREHLEKKQIPVLIPAPPADNGCCYCFVEPSGERTFAALHGAEYRFKREWFSLVDSRTIGSVYVCGLELEEDTGSIILDYLEERPEYTVYFAPGPRISCIRQRNLDRMFSLSPILHLNGDEALGYTGVKGNPDQEHKRQRTSGPEGIPASCPAKPAACPPPVTDYLPEAASRLASLTHNHVIITLGACGAFHMDSSGKYELIPGYQARQTDTTGAGDSHIGAVIACRMKGFPMDKAIRTANRISAAVVEHAGAGLEDVAFPGIEARNALEENRNDM